MTTLEQLMNWRLAHCDGDWEHTYGVRISSLDNPGWMVTVDVAETELEDFPFTDVAEDRTEQDWIRCRIEEDENRRFVGYGGPMNLEELILIFLDWANAGLDG